MTLQIYALLTTDVSKIVNSIIVTKNVVVQQGTNILPSAGLWLKTCAASCQCTNKIILYCIIARSKLNAILIVVEHLTQSYILLHLFHFDDLHVPHW